MDHSTTARVPRGKDSVCELGFVRYSNENVICNWTILEYNNFPKQLAGVKSPTFWHSGSTEWCMELAVENGEWFLRFSLLSSKRSASEEATVRASLISSQGKEYKVFPPQTVSLETPMETKWTRASDFFDRESCFKNELKFQGEVSIPSIIAEPYRNVVLPRELGSIVRDLGALLDSGDETDIMLVAGDTKLRAHRAILFARSPVFATMLCQCAAEDETGCGYEMGGGDKRGIIEINDVDPDTMREILRYIYTDEAPHLKTMPDKLLVAAAKYGLPKLKKWCELELSEQLTVDNAVAVAVIALTHKSAILTPVVVSFIKKQLSCVLGTDSWADAVKENPEIVMEISRLTADKPVAKEL